MQRIGVGEVLRKPTEGVDLQLMGTVDFGLELLLCKSDVRWREQVKLRYKGATRDICMHSG